jgi:hypothetical protein
MMLIFRLAVSDRSKGYRLVEGAFKVNCFLHFAKITDRGNRGDLLKKHFLCRDVLIYHLIEFGEQRQLLLYRE